MKTKTANELKVGDVVKFATGEWTVTKLQRAFDQDYQYNLRDYRGRPDPSGRTVTVVDHVKVMMMGQESYSAMTPDGHIVSKVRAVFSSGLLFHKSDKFVMAT